MRLWVALALATACGSDRDRAAPSTSPPTVAPPRTPTADARPVDATLAEAGGDCPDPHVGLWVGRSFQDGHWNEFRIELRRSGGDLTCFEETRW